MILTINGRYFYELEEQTQFFCEVGTQPFPTSQPTKDITTLCVCVRASASTLQLLNQLTHYDERLYELYAAGEETNAKMFISCNQ